MLNLPLHFPRRRLAALAFGCWLCGLLCGSGLLAGCQTKPAPTAAVEAPVAQLQLTEVDWRLVTLRGAAVTVPAGEPGPTLRLDSTGLRASGSTGVNRFTGGYTLRGTDLKFQPLATTRMAGSPEAMSREAKFLQALSSVTAGRLTGATLELLAGDTVVASFAAP